LVTFSEQFNSWTLIGGGSVTSNSTTSPDGFANADTIEPLGYAKRIITMAGGSNTFSIYFKAKDTNCLVRIGFLGVGDSSLIDAQETITTSQWKRMTITYTNAVAPLGVYFNIQSGDNDVFVWGAQVEAGSYPTSYIPTLGSSVTRLADVGGNKTSSSALIGQAQGTMFLEVQVTQNTPSAAAVLLGVFDATAANNRIQIVTRLGFLQTYIEANSVGYVVNQTLATLTAGTTYKVALAYSSAGIVVYVNGASVYTNTSALAFTATLETISVGSRAAIDTFGQGERIASSALYTTRLSNSELASLTSL
jgi:hypothetical protein